MCQVLHTLGLQKWGEKGGIVADVTELTLEWVCVCVCVCSVLSDSL